MMVDKGYYDYDFDAKAVETQHKKINRKERTHEQTQSIFTRMGFGKVKKLDSSQPLTPEEMQRIAMDEAKERKM